MAWGGDIWPDNRRCSRCGNKHTCAYRPLSMPYCECDKRFSVKIGTVMERSKIGYRDRTTVTCLHATRPRGISSTRLGRDLGTS